MILERLAELEHKQWVHWTRYFLEALGQTKESENPNVRRWWRQIETPYSELTEMEKDSDRAWARKVVEIVSEEFLP